MFYLTEYPNNILNYWCKSHSCFVTYWEKGGPKEIWVARIDNCIQCHGTHFFAMIDPEFVQAVNKWKQYFNLIW